MSSESHLSAPESNSFGLILKALDKDVSPEKLSALLAVRRDWEADEARKAFNVSISEFQKRAPIIAKADKAYDKEYARMDRIWREIRPLLTELGLSVTWQVCELRDQLCHVEGQLRHRAGHGEKLTQDIPMPELIKGQNKAQQMGSASTYAKRYALCGALGIVTGEDLDGNDIGGQLTITEDQEKHLRNLLDAARGIATFDEDKFWKYLAKLGADKLADLYKTQYEEVAAQLHKKIKGDAS